MQHTKNLSAVGVVFSVFSFTAQAQLINETVENDFLVYDTINNATWTQDANLLGTLEANAISQFGDDNSLITDIINASAGVIADSANDFDNGTYTLTSFDFGSDGTVDWWAAKAFVHYLDTQNYAGSGKWTLPTSNAVFGNDNGSQLGKLFYNELGGTAGNSIPTGPFRNVQADGYYTANQYASDVDYAWFFSNSNGSQNISTKDSLYYVWAVSPGNVSAVPAPSAVWLFGIGMVGLLSLKIKTVKPHKMGFALI